MSSNGGSVTSGRRGGGSRPPCSSVASGSPPPGGDHQHIYPATGQPNAVVPLAGALEIERAVASGWQAHRAWMPLPVDRRRDLLIDLADVVHEHLDELALLNVRDYAVPVSYAGTALMLERFLRHFAGYVDKPQGSSTPVQGLVDVNPSSASPSAWWVSSPRGTAHLPPQAPAALRCRRQRGRLCPSELAPIGRAALR